MKFITLLTLVGVSTALGACGISDQTSGLNQVKYSVSEVSATTSGFGIVANYEKVVRVRSDGGVLSFTLIMDALYRNVASGSNGLCPTCESDTPVSQQNNGRGLISAKGIMPRDVMAPSFFKGEVSLNRVGSNLAIIEMRSISHGLDGSVQIFKVSDTEYRVVESGECRGPFAGTFCKAHNSYFDLASAVRRQIR